MQMPMEGEIGQPAQWNQGKDSRSETRLPPLGWSSEGHVEEWQHVDEFVERVAPRSRVAHQAIQV